MRFCVSVRWVTLWVHPPPCENVCVRSLGYNVGAPPPEAQKVVNPVILDDRKYIQNQGLAENVSKT